MLYYPRILTISRMSFYLMIIKAIGAYFNIDVNDIAYAMAKFELVYRNLLEKGESIG